MNEGEFLHGSQRSHMIRVSIAMLHIVEDFVTFFSGDPNMIHGASSPCLKPQRFLLTKEKGNGRISPLGFPYHQRSTSHHVEDD